VASDAAVKAMLQGAGRALAPGEPIRVGADGHRAAAVWRDADGNVFLPCDPGEVARQFWSEGYRERLTNAP
jgi:hypothetical protein